jgi:hypothetical protein
MRVITDNEIFAEGATALAKALESNRTLTKLDLGSACFAPVIA